MSAAPVVVQAVGNERELLGAAFTTAASSSSSTTTSTTTNTTTTSKPSGGGGSSGGGGMSLKNKVRVAVGILHVAIAAVLGVLLCARFGDLSRSLRWIVALPVCVAVVVPGQMYFC